MANAREMHTFVEPSMDARRRVWMRIDVGLTLTLLFVEPEPNGVAREH